MTAREVKFKSKRGEEQEIKVATFGSKAVKVIRNPTTKLDIKLRNNKYLTVCANIVPEITGTIHRKAVKLTRSEQIVHLMNSLDMADNIPRESEYSSLELLIGNDYYLDIVLPQRVEVQPGLYLLGSKLGWILTGRTGENEIDQNSANIEMPQHLTVYSKVYLPFSMKLFVITGTHNE